VQTPFARKPEPPPKPKLVVPGQPPDRPYVSTVQPRHKYGARRKYLWPISLILALALGYAALRYQTTAVVSVVAVKPQEVVQTLVASGHVETPFRINIASQVTGRVKDVSVSEGQAVKANDVLVQLDSAEAEQAVAQARAVQDQAEARLSQLQDVAGKLANEAENQARAGLVEAQLNYDRAAKLALRGYSSTAAVDAARKALDVAQSQLSSAKLQTATNAPGGHDYQLAQAQLDQAKAAMRSAETRLSYVEIRSPRDGTLISRNVERGNVVQPGITLFALAPKGELQLVAQIDELNLGLLQPGQKATAVADAYPGKSFDATLSYINPGIDPQRGAVEVKLSVPKPPSYLVQDMTVSVEIIVARHPNSMAVETVSVNELNSPKPWLWVVNDGTVHKREITRGIIGDSVIEVTSGLDEGDSVVKGQGLSLSEGQRVRIKTNEQ
jgi:HlyD family secretion protein